MTLHEQIKDSIKQAMLAKDEKKLNVLRGLLSDFTNELVAKKRKPNEILIDEDALAVIKRSAKRRMDSIEQFRAGNRKDLVKIEEEELDILEPYLPKLMKREEILPLVIAKKEALAITDKTKAGLLVGAVMKDLKGKAEGGDVKAIVDELLK